MANGIIDTPIAIRDLEKKRWNHFYGFSVCYEGPHEVLVKLSILDCEQKIPKFNGRIRIRDGRIVKITRLRSGHIRVIASVDLADDWLFREFLRKALLPLPPAQLKNLGNSHGRF